MIALISTEMDLKQQILREHSKANRDAIIQWVGRSQSRFDQLVNILLENEHLLAQRASWPLSCIAEDQPGIVHKHIGRLIEHLETPGIHTAVKRHVTRLLQYVEIPEELRGQLMDTCFKFAASPTESVAVKAFALTILQNMSKFYPEILPELEMIIRDRWEYETAGFRSRARKIVGS